MVEVVDVDGRHPVVDIPRDRTREPFADPHGDGNPLLGQLPFPRALTGSPSDAAGHVNQLVDGEGRGLGSHPGAHDERREDADQPGRPRPREPGEAEEIVRRSPGEHAPVDAPARQDAAPVSGLLRLHERGVAGAGEVDVGPPPLVVIVKPRNVRHDAVHRRHLEGRCRRRDPHGHRREPVSLAVHEPPEERHVPAGQRLLEHGAREPVDLDDQEPPPAGSGRTPEPDPPDDPVDSTLEAKKEILEGTLGGSAGIAAHRSLGLSGSNVGRPATPATRVGAHGIRGLRQGQEHLRREVPAGAAEAHRRRDRELPGILQKRGRPHEVGPDRQRRPGARELERRALVEADPDDRDQTRRVAGEPGVPRVVGGTGLARRGAGEAEPPRRRSGAAVHHAAKEMCDQVRLRSRKMRRAASRYRSHAAPVDRPDAVRPDRRATVGQGRVRRAELERRHLEASQRQRRHGRHPAREADVARRSDHPAEAGSAGEPDGCDVGGLLERPPHGDQALEPVLEIAGRIHRLAGSRSRWGDPRSGTPGSPSAARPSVRGAARPGTRTA